MTSAAPDLLVERHGSVVFASFNRPDAKNALNSNIVDGLFALAKELLSDRSARVLVLRGSGGTFCAGGDIREFGRLLMSPDPGPGEQDAAFDSNRRFGDLLLAIDALPQVVVAVVEGAAFGGAMGLIAVADVAIASSDAKFSLSETTLGLVPAQIGPFVVRKIGLMAARRLALTGSRFGANEAERVGFIDTCVSGELLKPTLDRTLAEILKCEPGAVAATKALFNRSVEPVSAELLDEAAGSFAKALRAGGRIGAAAFAAKSQPAWVESWTPSVEPKR